MKSLNASLRPLRNLFNSGNMKKRLFLFLLMGIGLAACSRQHAQFELAAPGTPDGTEYVLARLAINQWVAVDTLQLQGGKITYTFAALHDAPEFYCLLKDQQRVASFVVNEADRLNIVLGQTGSVEVNGSEEAYLFHKQEKDFEAAQASFESLSLKMAQASASGNKALQEKCQLDLGRFYVKYKQESIRFLMKHPQSIVQVPTLYRRFSDELPIFNEYRDALYFGRVYDSLRITYPKSTYLHALKEERDYRTAMLQLEKKLSQAKTATYPDLSMPDRDGKIRNLSDAQGKLILLSFWSAADANQKLFNNELKALYEKYHQRGLEIYQVALNADKTQWAQTVKEQQLPWISVCDGMGAYSVAAAYYNVGSVPAMYLIDQAGNIRPERNEFDPVALDRLIGRLLR